MIVNVKTPWLMLFKSLLVSLRLLSAPGLEEGNSKVLAFAGGVKEVPTSEDGTAKRFKLRTNEPPGS